jgi:hypothetical protein
MSFFSKFFRSPIKSKNPVANRREVTNQGDIQVQATKTSGIERLLFESGQAIQEYIIDGIKTFSPGRVLIVGNPNRTDFLRVFTSQYELFINNTCSLNWLCRTAEEIRTKGKKAILVSNFPRDITPPATRFVKMPNGEAGTVTMPPRTSLCLCSAADKSTTCIIYVVGAYSSGYVENVYKSQADGRKSFTTLHVLVEFYDPMLLDKERTDLRACRDKSECQRVLWKIAQDQERDPKCFAYRGGILVE